MKHLTPVSETPKLSTKTPKNKLLDTILEVKIVLHLYFCFSKSAFCLWYQIQCWKMRSLGRMRQNFHFVLNAIFLGESFVADATYLGVSTTKCEPFTCDFPRQLCMRPAEKYQDETANQCKNIPSEVCLFSSKF